MISPSGPKFVPPPVHEFERTVSDLERFVHKDDNILPLTKAELLYAQFETLHPFRHGNVWTERMLTTLYLREIGLPEKTSAFFI